MEDSEVPELIDFFKSEVPLRQNRKQEYVCRPWSTQVTVPAERAIADGEPEPPSGILVDFFKGGNGDDPHHYRGDDAVALNRSSSDCEHPMAKFGEHWSLQVANPPGALKIVSPTSTGTEESGTAAPKTPTCDMEIAYSRPCPDQYEYSAHQGSTGFPDSSRLFPVAIAEIRNKQDHNGEASGTSHGRKRLKRIPPACIAPPLMRSEPLEQTPTSCFREFSTQTRVSHPQDEDTEAVVQAATSLLSLVSNEGNRRSSPERSASDEGIPRSSPERLASDEGIPRSSPEHSASDEGIPRSSPERLASDEGIPRSSSEPEGSGRESCSSVLCRPNNKRRYRLMVDLLAECPRVVP